MTKYETKMAVRAEIKKTTERIRMLKIIRAVPGQPGWQGSSFGLELEQRKGLATLLCSARARARNRRHILALPRTIMVAPREGKPHGLTFALATQAEFDRVCDEELAARIPGYQPIQIPTPAKPQEEQAA